MIEIFRSDQRKGFFAGGQFLVEFVELMKVAIAIGEPYNFFIEVEALSDHFVEFVLGQIGGDGYFFVEAFELHLDLIHFYNVVLSTSQQHR